MRKTVNNFIFTDFFHIKIFRTEGRARIRSHSLVIITRESLSYQVLSLVTEKLVTKNRSIRRKFVNQEKFEKTVLRTYKGHFTFFGKINSVVRIRNSFQKYNYHSNIFFIFCHIINVTETQKKIDRKSLFKLILIRLPILKK